MTRYGQGSVGDFFDLLFYLYFFFYLFLYCMDIAREGVTKGVCLLWGGAYQKENRSRTGDGGICGICGTRGLVIYSVVENMVSTKADVSLSGVV
ncbi:hypothetical protein COCSADRAFT_234082 [Bipolaris sorokiniana ND90Pr]|uniref:Uncharacterized protein n=1 Tax=Cochliobolus sativus (strain ND90Pr / ATCC 201652) TaxID=665912 RepID=M2SXK5_COCSN|nr:uncharacterized protein COCSADRAFT_234082 [Bipolaris sorokiniana ND90Pr]EMD61661.1 hypothetical protein COCSADRAFT_234082 [Bipolaris sorokiniana ND90Pr]